MNRRPFLPLRLLWISAVILTMLLCVCAGSVAIPLSETLRILHDLISGIPVTSTFGSIILSIRLPRVLCVALVGASLSVCGCAMQGLLRNPLADGSTLGVSAGASLGAVLALALGLQIPGLRYGATMISAMLFAFLSLLLILSLAFLLDRTLETTSIILIGVIFSMFASSIMSLIITFAGERIRSITFWTMGSLSGSTYPQALILFLALAFCYMILRLHAEELNAFAISEENALHIGVNVRRVKLIVLVTVSVLIGVCVSIGGSIAFVGLVVPHMLRMVLGPNHDRLLPSSLYGGAVFLLLADLAGRTVLSPIELPIGVVTSLVGAVIFMLIFYRSRKGRL
ncbi:MAG: iron ABC transporter permease [Clostridiales bacterium]|nr:iron ABC transporter permease [Clostridia bacterium]MCR4883384.1 iron ABC transporter permease [Clostridiales bacterium]